jgi:FkbM family methyltransferase
MATSTSATFSQSPRQRPAAKLSLPIVVGPLRGCWWQPAAGGKLARMLMGTYETAQSQLFLRHIEAGQQVLDIGASVGYYTLLAARLVGSRGHVYAFEPDPTNLAFLQGHVTQNRFSQVTVLPCALNEQAGTARFGGGTGTGTSRLCADGAIEVTVRRLDDVVRELELTPDCLKIDVEGAEVGVLKGGEQAIRKYRPTIFLSTHGGPRGSVHQTCCQLLQSWGYRLSPIEGAAVESASELLCLAK